MALRRNDEKVSRNVYAAGDRHRTVGARSDRCSVRRPGRSTAKFHRKGPRAIPQKYIVVLNDDVDAATADFATAVDRTMEVTRGTGAIAEHIYAFALRGFAARMTEQDALRLSQDPRVRFVEEDSIMEAIATQSNPPSWGLIGSPSPICRSTSRMATRQPVSA